MYIQIIFTCVDNHSSSDTTTYKIKNMYQFYQYLINEFKNSDYNSNEIPEDPRNNDPNFIEYIDASIRHYLYHEKKTVDDLDVPLMKKIINKYDCYNKGDGDYYEIKIKNIDEPFVDLTEN